MLRLQRSWRGYRPADWLKLWTRQLLDSGTRTFIPTLIDYLMSMKGSQNALSKSRPLLLAWLLCFHKDIVSQWHRLTLVFLPSCKTNCS